MFLDARTMNDKVHTCDICIIGAGAAGITLARALKNSPVQICLLESGGLEPEAETQSLYKGDVTGFPYYPLESTRVRYFGGTTAHWGGCCWPLEDNEFHERDWVPHSGWPFSRKELDPYYVLAQETCELGPFNYDPGYWSKESDRPLLPLAKDSKVVTKLYQNSSPPTLFGTKYRDDIKNATNISAILHANVTKLTRDPINQTVDKVTVKTLEGTGFEVKADKIVIAAGGLENTRLLLLNDIGNQNDLVGRYFMEHIIFSAATLLIRGNIDTDLYQRAPVNGFDIRGGLSLRNDILAKERILNSWSGFRLQRSPTLIIEKEWTSIKSILSKGGFPDGLKYHVTNILKTLPQLYNDKWSDSDEPVTIPIQSFSEQAPNPMSRVTLGDEVDALGQRRIKLNWRITDLDQHSIRRTQEIVAAEIGRNNLGRVQVLVDEEPDVWSDPGLLPDTASLPVGSFHHMGTTRMHTDPKKGVVDENCRVYGTKNLYIAGSSVFPTCGFENPTLTIVAMAYRLGDHLRPHA